MKQETLEEFCNRELENFNGSDTRSTEFDLGFITGTIIGIRFSKERSYSEEEVMDILLLSYSSISDKSLAGADLRKWFEQFKKK